MMADGHQTEMDEAQREEEETPRLPAIRHPQHCADGIRIDCEIEHPRYGWIPFTANPDDPEEHGRLIHAAIIAGAAGKIAAALEPSPPSPEEIQARYVAAIQSHLDATCRARGYDGMVSCVSYAGSTIPSWAGEAAAAIAWRDAVWAHAYALLAAPPDPLPSPAEMIASPKFPVIAWPTG